ncbi:MAG: HAD-IC family P-type ATPase, partial [Patescibacteria group bacterium]
GHGNYWSSHQTFGITLFVAYNKEMEEQKVFHTRWHAISWEETAAILETNAKNGLAEKEGEKRKEIFGPNTLPEEKPPSRSRIFFKQFGSPLVFILVIAGFVTFGFHEYTDSMVIFGTVLFNTFIGYLQENKASNALIQLKKILKGKASVWRGGERKEIPSEDLVPGDIIFLNPGSKVPADGRIMDSWNLKINEAVLTGEWIASSKHSAALDEKTPLADRDNMVYTGSLIQEGNGKAIVTVTGIHTEVGKIGTLLKTIEEEHTPYQKKLTQFAWMMGVLISILAFFIFLQGVSTGSKVLEMFKVATAIAVAAIPEGLPIAMTIVLAVGMQRILAQKGLVRRLVSAETLGSTSVIATDKTLTLTEGSMEVEEIAPLKVGDREQMLIGAALANEAFIENPQEALEEWIIRGRATDQALIRAAMEAGISKIELEKNLPLLFRLPLDSETKYIASFHQVGQGVKAYLSGAPERILTLSVLSEDERQQGERKLNELTERGLRVVCVASKDITQVFLEERKKNDLPQNLLKEIKDLRLIGFIALRDPLRKGVKEAIGVTKEAGIQTIIVTGDHVLTAKAVAKEIGLPTSSDEVIEGKDLNLLSDEELQSRISRLSVYARVEPAHKLRIIEAWQRKGAVIAMTGDGVNDAPALKKADIGIALGSGTEVAKEASDLVLLEDDFSIIPAAVKEGRVILDNMRKIITYMLAGTFTETILIGASIMGGAPFLPVTALQILWMNLIEDMFPAIALAFEKPEKDVMKRKPKEQDSSLFTGAMKTIIFVIGILSVLLLLGLFFWLLKQDVYSQERLQTILFVGLGIDSLLYVFSCKSLRKNIWEYNPFSNLYLVGSVLLGFLLLNAVIYVPFLQFLFHTEALNFFDWTFLGAFGILAVTLIEAAKWYFIRKERA